MIALRGPHTPRPVRFLGLEELGDWRVKLYGIAAGRETPRPELVDAARAVAADALPQPAIADDRYGLAFVTVHDAADYGFVLVDWWHDENEIHQRLFSSPLDAPARLSPHPSAAIGCVWELRVTDFERRAWLDCVLANPNGPDVDAYLARRFDGKV